MRSSSHWRKSPWKPRKKTGSPPLPRSPRRAALSNDSREEAKLPLFVSCEIGIFPASVIRIPLTLNRTRSAEKQSADYPNTADHSTLRPNPVVHSRKKDNAIRVSKDRLILVLKALVRPRGNRIIRQPFRFSLRWKIHFSIALAYGK